jgi:ABC-type multidrug transport system fused ATPase/permease subunit
MKIKTRIKHSSVARSIQLLPKSDRRRIAIVVVVQISLGFLDLLGVATVGILGALAVSGVQSQLPGSRVANLLEFIGLADLQFQKQVAFLGLLAAVIFVLRTVISMFMMRRILYFLSRRGAAMSARLTSKLLSQSLVLLQTKSTQEIVYSLTSGVSAITLGVLATSIAIIADASLLLILISGLFIVDPTIAIVTIIFFGILGFILYKSLNVKSHDLGKLNSELAVKSNEKIVEVMESYRESVVRNRRSYYAREIGDIRFKIADVLAEIQYMPNVSKYVIESGMVIGAVAIAGIQFGLQDARHAVATLSVFLAAGARIAPALMRLQISLITMKNSLGASIPTLNLIESLSSISEIDNVEDMLVTDHRDFKAEVVIENVDLKYPNKNTFALKHINLEVKIGKSLAIVGPSGAGKTSLVDVLLGVIPHSSGSVKISGYNPQEAIKKWSGALSYVPQDVSISNGSFRENVALGYPTSEIDDALVWEALETAQLSNFVRSLPEGLDTPVGERGTKISGGQRQRLGIARAMFTKPRLLVLDEATSSLDGQSEADISDAIKDLQGSVTVVMIAHRLSTVRNADQVIYMDEGRIMARGTFEEVRKSVPDFDHQAQLMGL